MTYIKEKALVDHWRAARRRLLTPSVSETKPEKRGFNVKNPAARKLLERVGETFLTGYGHAVEARGPAEAETPLEGVPAEFRGFAYEGAAMGCAVLDGLPFGRRDRFERLLRGRGDAHVYMVHVGLGWAMARLPRFRWPDPAALDPLLRWLVLDGYGFHQAYFHTDRYVHRRLQDRRPPWPGPYAGNAVDQGIGRALWFVGGTDTALVAAMIDRFPESRRPDLFSGAGLAATYAGGAGEDELVLLRERSGDLRSQVAQGSAFAAEARVRAGLVVPHTHVATRVFCDMTPSEAARITQEVRPNRPGPYDYEAWRQRIAQTFASVGGVRK
jgi:enediyne biosynthesis protein E3